ncbi:sulfate adenylyltransferase subunit CysN [Polynucleobacter sp. HIN6]|uniref:adenylyl-sulfate kinase n=1 Tax=Polynucleobacter sp. HIN6 TaxID=3047865 RepID=UPI00257414B2|nr:adenylyl-sulfate kinase [Polynucleobacter sp. HIN6]BEI35270.1 sulfate adenylyltransferase subunit CysN [Polynucleobacter sp. HIN6]
MTKTKLSNLNAKIAQKENKIPKKKAGILVDAIKKTPKDIESFLAKEKEQDLLRFITCGSVDDGKSTLIGRLLYDSHSLLEDQIESLQKDSKKFGTQGEALDFALLVDGLAAEREQGITIDVAYRFFSTDKRKFIVADTPGHEQYTRNMITGASTADLAVILVDATQGVLTQTKRHAYLVSLMGIKQIILAINKIDLVPKKQEVFHQIVRDFEAHISSLHFNQVTAIPVSALLGYSITSHSHKLRWYQGPTLMQALESAVILSNAMDKEPKPFAMPVQWVNRPNAQFRGFSGTIASGSISIGDEIRVTSSGQTANIKNIITPAKTLTQKGDFANQGEAITLTLTKDIDVSRGDVLTLANVPLSSSDQFEATLIWLDQAAGLSGRTYELMLSTQQASATITSIKHRIDVNTFEKKVCHRLELNDIALCTIALNKPVAYDTYSQSKELGGFILIDRFSNAIVAAGLIHHGLRRADNIHTQALNITKPEREKLNGHKGKVIWFTGLSGSGKSTLANELEIALHQQGQHTYLLDGDNIRQGLNKDLGFTEADRVENIRRIAEVAKLMMDAGLIVMTAFISPFKREREMARELIGKDNFIEVFVNTPIQVCEERDPKGLYKKAREGKLPNFSGISSPYERPENPDIEITVSTVENQMKILKNFLIKSQ